MATFEWIIALLLGAALLATLARRVGAPYPTFLAIVELNSSEAHDTPVNEVPGGDACRVPVQELDCAELSAGGNGRD